MTKSDNYVNSQILWQEVITGILVEVMDQPQEAVGMLIKLMRLNNRINNNVPKMLFTVAVHQ
jgi:hypothetical protein